jgi:hypothetical protein
MTTMLQFYISRFVDHQNFLQARHTLGKSVYLSKAIDTEAFTVQRGLVTRITQLFSNQIKSNQINQRHPEYRWQS